MLLHPRTIPVSLLKEDNLIPTCYIVHVHSNVCTHCGLIEEHSQLFAKNDLRSRSTNQPIEHLVATDKLRYKLPIYTMPMPERYSPCCQNCAGDIDLSSLPPPPMRRSETWGETVARKMREAETGALPTKSKSQPKVKTVDDLFTKFDL